MNVLIVVNGPAYGSELPFNARMIHSLLRRGGEVGCCGTCLDARGLEDKQLVEDAFRSTMEQLADWTLEADRVVTF